MPSSSLPPSPQPLASPPHELRAPVPGVSSGRPRPPLDLSSRLDPALLPELMDEPCPYETFRATLRSLEQLNRLLLAYRPSLRFLRTALPQRSGQAVSVLDVGSGAGDTLRQIARWAVRHRQPLQLTGIDLNPHAMRAAQDFSGADRRFGHIQWITGNVFTHPAVQAPDLVHSSLVTHHMRDEEIVRFLRWMEDHARTGWFISDIVRSPRSYRLYRPLTRLLRSHPYVQHDGLVSIRRAFREPDWLRFLQAAGIPPSAVRLHRCGIGRLCLTRLR